MFQESHKTLYTMGLYILVSYRMVEVFLFLTKEIEIHYLLQRGLCLFIYKVTKNNLTPVLKTYCRIKQLLYYDSTKLPHSCVPVHPPSLNLTST